jgi:hypothetical protein
MAEKSRYRVTMPKDWSGPVRVSVHGLVFDRRQEDKEAEDGRVKHLNLSAKEAKDLKASGFKLVENQGAASDTSRLSERVKAPKKADAGEKE